jgi:hypothetical protein
VVVLQQLPCLIDNLDDFKDVDRILYGKSFCQMRNILWNTFASIRLAYLTCVCAPLTAFPCRENVLWAEKVSSDRIAVAWLTLLVFLQVLVDLIEEGNDSASQRICGELHQLGVFVGQDVRLYSTIRVVRPRMQKQENLRINLFLLWCDP